MKTNPRMIYDPTRPFWHFVTCVLPFWRKPRMFWFMLRRWFRWHAYWFDHKDDKWKRRKVWFCRPNPPVPPITE